MNLTPVNAPGCFSAASVFAQDSEVCRRCGVFDACSDASMKTLKAIRDIVNIEDLMKRHVRAKLEAQTALKEADQKAAAELPPGNLEQPLSQPVQRKTQVVQIKFEASADEQSIIALLPVKPQVIALSLCKTGMLTRIRSELAAGRNALALSGPGFIRVALTLLLAGGFVKSELNAALQSELKWAEGTASSHVSIVCALLKAFSVAEEIEGRFILTPTLSA